MTITILLDGPTSYDVLIYQISLQLMACKNVVKINNTVYVVSGCQRELAFFELRNFLEN